MDIGKANMDRRGVLGLLGMAGLTPWLASCSSDSGSSGSGKGGGKLNLVMATYPGYEDRFQKHAIDPFLSSHSGAKVKLTTTLVQKTYGQLVADRKNPVVNLGVVNPQYAYRGMAIDLWATLNRANLPNLDHVTIDVPKQFSSVLVPWGANPYAIVYNPKKVERPTSWLDLMRPEYAGRVGLPNDKWEPFVALNKIRGRDPMDIEAAMKEWQRHRKNIAFWSAGAADLNENIARGEVWMAPGWLSPVVRDKRAGKDIDFVVPKEGGFLVLYYAMIPAGQSAEVQTACEQLANLYLSPQMQKALTELYFIPTVKGVEPAVPAADSKKEFGFALTAEDASRSLQVIDDAYTAKHGQEFQRLRKSLLM